MAEQDARHDDADVAPVVAHEIAHRVPHEETVETTRRERPIWDRLMRLTRYRLVVPLRRSRMAPEVKARGVAVGLFWAFTLLVGIQMYLCLMTWLPVRVLRRWDFSVLIAMAWTWVSNVFTMIPIYYIFYATGQLMTGQFDDLSGYAAFADAWHDTFGADLGTWEALGQYGTWLAKEVGVAMVIGCVPYAFGFAWAGCRLSFDYMMRRQRRREDAAAS